MSPNFNEIIQSVNQFEMLHQCFSVVDSAGLSEKEKHEFFNLVNELMFYIKHGKHDLIEFVWPQRSKVEKRLLNVFMKNEVLLRRCCMEGIPIYTVLFHYEQMVRDDITVVTVESLDAYLDWENLDDDDEEDSDVIIQNQEEAPRRAAPKSHRTGLLRKLVNGLGRRRREYREYKAKKTNCIHLFRQCEAFVEHGRNQLDNLEEERREYEESSGSPFGAEHDQWITHWQARHDEALHQYQSRRNELCRRLDEAKMRHKRFLFPSCGDGK